MMNRKLWPIVFMALAACSSSVFTDGSPDAELVRDWLGPGIFSRDDLVAPGALLVMSNYSVLLTRANLHKLGPDKLAGCRIASIRRRTGSVLASWECGRPLAGYQKKVWFRVEHERIVSANYTEAVMGDGS